MTDSPSYGDVLGRPKDDPNRDEIKATPDWTPVAIPGRPGWWRHCLPDGTQVDTDSQQPPTN